MSESHVGQDPGAASDSTAQVMAPPIRSRFLFVDVAAQRAKQLRRGALPRLEQISPEAGSGHRLEIPRKLERVAMEEVRHGLIGYELPEPKGQLGEEGA